MLWSEIWIYFCRAVNHCFLPYKRMPRVRTIVKATYISSLTPPNTVLVSKIWRDTTVSSVNFLKVGLSNNIGIKNCAAREIRSKNQEYWIYKWWVQLGVYACWEIRLDFLVFLNIRCPLPQYLLKDWKSCTGPGMKESIHSKQKRPNVLVKFPSHNFRQILPCEAFTHGYAGAPSSPAMLPCAILTESSIDFRKGRFLDGFFLVLPTPFPLDPYRGNTSARELSLESLYIGSWLPCLEH